MRTRRRRRTPRFAAWSRPVPEHLPPICVLAGGLGTRLGSKVRDIPKPLLPVGGEPFLAHQLRLLAAHGARDLVLCVGYLGEQIEQQIGSECFGLRITYSYDGRRPLGTLGAVRRAAPLLGPRFLVLYGDTYLRIDYRAATHAWAASRRPAMMTVLRNEGRWDVSNASFDGELVTAYDKRDPAPAMEWIDYGLGGLDAAVLSAVGEDVCDLSDLYHRLARLGSLFGYPATERFYEIGTPEALAATSAFLLATP
jgi:NDP-sugar pyrophosphorylase family protein